MKLKKVLICALSISLLAACGNQEAEEKPAEEPKAVEETQTETKEETKPEEKEEVKEEPAKEEAKTSQVIQAEAGETQKDNYFTWETDNAIYKQTGDAFITTSQYDDKKILVIPINFTNKQEDTADPWFAFALDFKAYQEDDNQEYILNGGQGLIPEEYSSPVNTNIKKDGNIDYFISFTLELPEADTKIAPQFGSGEVYTFSQK